MWIFQFKFSSIFIARYIKYFVCLLFISNIFLKYWVIHLFYWNENQSIYKETDTLKGNTKSICSARGHRHVRMHKGRGREGRGQVKCAYICRQGGAGSSRLGANTQNLKTFLFVCKRSYYIAIYYCVWNSVNWP